MSFPFPSSFVIFMITALLNLLPAALPPSAASLHYRLSSPDQKATLMLALFFMQELSCIFFFILLTGINAGPSFVYISSLLRHKIMQEGCVNTHLFRRLTFHFECPTLKERWFADLFCPFAAIYDEKKNCFLRSGCTALINSPSSPVMET